MKKKKITPDGKFTEADAFELHPDFESEYEHMTEEFMAEHNPGLLSVMERLKSADKKPNT